MIGALDDTPHYPIAMKGPKRGRVTFLILLPREQAGELEFDWLGAIGLESVQRAE